MSPEPNHSDLEYRFRLHHGICDTEIPYAKVEVLQSSNIRHHGLVSGVPSGSWSSVTWYSTNE